MSETNIVTGQYVQISQSPASIGERMLAQMIDAFILFVYAFGMGLLIYNTDDYLNDKLQLYSAFFVFLSVLFYSFYMELFNHGQSLGKMIMRIRVVKKDGTTPGIGDFFMRWLLQFIDIGFSFVGVAIILLTKNSQRLGDLAAHTMVIKINNYHKIQVSLDEFSYLDRNYKPVYPQAEDLSLNQIEVIQRTLNADYGSDRERRIATLAPKVREHLGISDTRTGNEKFLYTIIRDYQHYSLEMV